MPVQDILKPAEYVYQRPKLSKPQSVAFFNDFRYAWTEDSTMSGKTVSCMAWIVEQAVFLGKEGRRFWWCAWRSDGARALEHIASPPPLFISIAP